MGNYFFNQNTLNFFKIFKPLTYGYVIVWAWSLDWRVYEEMRPYFFNPPGILGALSSSSFSPLFIQCLKWILSLSGVSLIFGNSLHKNAFLFFICAFLLDCFHNSFEFINAQIHVVWFCGLLCFVNFREETPTNSYVFRLIEMIVILVYFQSGIAKLMASGLDWALDGTTLQIAWLRQETSLGLLLSQSQFLAILCSSLALGFELLSPLYFIFKKYRQYFLLMGICFHLGTWMSMGIHFLHLWVFHIAAIISVYRLDVRGWGINSGSPEVARR